MSPMKKVTRAARLRWVPIADTRIHPQAQRTLRTEWAERIAADFDPEALGFPVVNERDGVFYVLDGQHRIEVCRMVGWGDQQIQCQTYTDLTDEEMAEQFLQLNTTKAVGAFDKFVIGVHAGRGVEADIDRIVRAANLKIGRGKGQIGAVGALRKVYLQGGAAVLSRALGVIRDAYGESGFDAPVIQGVGLVCQRYNGDLDMPTVVRRLSGAHGGVSGLLSKAEVLRRQTGNAKALCVAGAVVDTVNAGRGGKKLASWWVTA